MREHDDQIYSVLISQPRDVMRQFVSTQGEAHTLAERRWHAFVDDRRGDSDNSNPQPSTLDHVGWREDQLTAFLFVAVDG